MNSFFIKLTILLLVSFKANTSPYLTVEKYHEFEGYFLDIRKNCHRNIKLSQLPISFYYINTQIQNIYKETRSHTCHKSIDILKQKIERGSLENFFTVGYQTENKHSLNNIGRRNYKDHNIYLNTSKAKKNFSYNLNIIKNLNTKDLYFDNTYVTFKLKNHVIDIGALEKWWASSKRTSLILSNAARPIPSIAISNYKPIVPENKFFQLFKELNYTFSLGQLEKNRYVSNALIFTNKISINPHKNLELSFLRAAQFGGEGRAVDIETIKNMLLGKDTTNRNLSFNEQPGNQIAGIDFNLLINRNKNITLYGQILGEDGLDPIFGDGIGIPIFPSKRFGNIGITYLIKTDKPILVTMDYIDTNSELKNSTYNHLLYQSGYRYRGNPIGAHIDADSQNLAIQFKTFLNNQESFELELSKYHINKNNNPKNSFSPEYINFSELKARYRKVVNKNIYLDVNYYIRSDYVYESSHNLSITVEYKFK